MSTGGPRAVRPDTAQGQRNMKPSTACPKAWGRHAASASAGRRTRRPGRPGPRAGPRPPPGAGPAAGSAPGPTAPGRVLVPGSVAAAPYSGTAAPPRLLALAGLAWGAA